MFIIESTFLFLLVYFIWLDAAVAANPMTDSYLKLREQWNGIEVSVFSKARKQYIKSQVEWQFMHVIQN